MASADEFDLPENDDDTPSGSDDAKGLRKQLNKQAAEMKELREQLATALKEKRSSSLKDAFKEAGVNEKYAKFYDGEEVTVEAVKAWGVENDFIAAPASGDAPPANEPDPQIVAAQRIQQAVATGTPPPSDLLSQIKNTPFEDLVNAGLIKMAHYG